MGIQLARLEARPQSAVLVLGNISVAGRIGRDLGTLGFAPYLQERLGLELPSPADPNSPARLRSMIRDFLKGRGLGEKPGEGQHLIHPGVTVWADRPELNAVAQEFGINVIAPPPKTVSLFANKLNLLSEAEKIGIPNLMIGDEPIQSVREVEESIRNSQDSGGSRFTFPIVLKSIREGPAGFGIHVFHSEAELERELPLWIDQLRRNVGEAIFITEQHVEGARRISVPYARFSGGHTEVFPFVDSSLQSRYRKVIEFCPAFELDPDAERLLEDWTRRFAEHCGYKGLGVLEYLVDGPRVFLVEGLARLNTGFHLWEEVAGTTAVGWQIESLSQTKPSLKQNPKPDRAGLSLRIYAEDSLLQIPQPGWVSEMEVESEVEERGNRCEVDLGAAIKKEIESDSDGLLGICTVSSGSPKRAMTFAKKRLGEIWMAGSLQTNQRFLLELLSHPWIREGFFHAGFVDEEFVPQLRPPPEFLRCFASLCDEVVERSPSYKNTSDLWMVGDYWIKPDPKRMRYQTPPEVWTENELSGMSGTLVLQPEESYRFCVYPVSTNRWQVRIGNWYAMVKRVNPFVGDKGETILLKLFAQLGGRVHAILFREGAVVPPHEPLVMIESLQTLVPHAFPIGVKIRKWSIAAENHVTAGQVLAELERTDAKISNRS